jgi:hypothetical protein
MTRHCSKYTEKFISQYIDNELDSARSMEFSSHLGNCPDCKEKVNDFKRLSIVFNNHTETQVAQAQVAQAQVAQAQVAQASSLNMAKKFSNPGKHNGPFARFFKSPTDHLYIKLASLSAIAALLILIVFQPPPPQVSPSAIVKSLDTNASSVMIVETLNEKHTIIWFSET